MRPASMLTVVFVAVTAAWAQSQSAPPPDRDPRILRLMSSVSEERLRSVDEHLVSFGTRETLSASAPSRGNAAAGQWIRSELSTISPRLQVSFETFRLARQGRITHPVELRNVIAVLPGRTSRRIYISGHYDSVNVGSQAALNATPGAGSPQGRDDFDHDVDAPGANDDGSGTALTMELARVFAESGLSFDATLVFACWSGEEQGLIGSSAHAEQLARERMTVGALLNNDIVGNSHGGSNSVDNRSVRVFSLGPEDSPSRSLARYVARAAAIYLPAVRVRLMAREDRFERGSDHSSFTKQGYPAIVFRESTEDFARQHSARDTLDGVDFDYLSQNARINAAAAAVLALAPPAPDVLGSNGRPQISRGSSGYDAVLEWKPSPGASGYRVFWRRSWSLDWEHEQAVGNATRFVLPNVSIDNEVFGVAAVDADGHESLVSAYVAAPRRVDDVKLQP